MPDGNDVKDVSTHGMNVQSFASHMHEVLISGPPDYKYLLLCLKVTFSLRSNALACYS